MDELKPVKDLIALVNNDSVDGKQRYLIQNVELEINALKDFK